MPPLTSQLFAGDDLLQRIADDVGRVRISNTQNKTAPSVAKVQRALLLWRPDCLPTFGADGDYGSETASAVHRFKVEELHVPEAEVIDDVGPKTVQRLDEIALAHQAPPAANTPVVNSLSPATGAGGTLVVITGQNFVDVTSVSFGTTPAASFSVDSDTQISAEAPPVAFSGDVNVIVTTNAGSSQPSPGSAFTFAGAPAPACTVSAFNVPTGRSGCVREGNRAGERFRMEADFSGSCRCCEYRQFVRGAFIRNGRRIELPLADPGGGPPRPMLPRPAPGSPNDNFLEDGLVSPPAGANVFYGHRSEGATDPSDRYLPDRPTGCQYRGTDFATIPGSPGDTFTLDLDFRAQIIDTCSGNAVTRTTEWTVTCNGTF